MPRKSKSSSLPDWLWFFIALPISLITVLLMRQKKLPLPGRASLRPARYTEPDSIPLNMSEVPQETVTYAALAPDEAEAAADMASEGAPVAPVESLDDLKLIEGIGPSIAGLLRENGIASFHALANAPVERLTEILTAARLNHLADPTTWGEQARLAAAADWDTLEALQQTLKGGRKQR